MAKSKTKKENSIPPFDYNAELARLKREGPQRLYFIWGPEDYLAECFVNELRDMCIPNGDADFSYHKLNDKDFSALALRDAVDSVPFLTERTMVEVKSLDISRLAEEETESMIRTLDDIPDYCTVVFTEPSEFEPDKRKKLYKYFQKKGCEMFVATRSKDALINWVVKRFSAEGKRIELNAAQRLIFVSGDLMNRLIPEINKVAAYCKDSVVTVADVDAVAHHIPEAVLFDMTDALGSGEMGKAMFLLDELLAGKEYDEYAILGMLGFQMRQLYAARLAMETGKGKDYLKNTVGIKFDFAANKLLSAARNYSLPQLRRAVELCCDTEYKFKSAGTDRIELLKECVMRIAVGERDV